MSPPALPGVPERFTTPGVHASIHALDARVQRVESQTENIPELVRDMKEVKDGLATFKGYEATIKHLLGKGILLILGAVGSTFGVARITEPSRAPQATVVTKSATTVRVEACTAMQPGPVRDQCAIDILKDLMGPQR